MFKAFAVVAAVFVVTTIAIGQEPQQPAKDPVAQPQSRPAEMTGTVKNYDAGKTIVVEANGSPHSYDLTASDMTVTVNPDVKVGSKVKVTQKADSTGRKTITIEPAGKD